MIDPFAHAASVRATTLRRPNARLLPATLPTAEEDVVIDPLQRFVSGTLRSWLLLPPLLLVALPARPASPLPTRPPRPEAAFAERLALTLCALPPAPNKVPRRISMHPDRVPSRRDPASRPLLETKPDGPDRAFPARCGTRYNFVGARGALPATPLLLRRRPRPPQPPRRLHPPTAPRHPGAPDLASLALPASDRDPATRCGCRSASR